MPRRSNQEIGEEWERTVRDFFNEELCFENVDGGASFRPGGEQIDVVAGIHNVLFIGECKTKQELGRSGTLKSEIEKFRRKTIQVIRALNEYRGNKYGRYDHFVLLIITKDIVWTDADYEALTQPLPGDPRRAHTFDQDVIEYYTTIKDELSEDIARIHLLSDTGVRFPAHETLTVPAFKNSIKGLTIYNFVIAPQKILRYVSVARREARIKEYYQRMITGKRCQDIINYLDGSDTIFREGPVIPGNIILATRPGVIIEEENKQLKLDDTVFTKIKLPANYGIFWIVDGQHRLYAYSKTSIHHLARSVMPEDKVFITLLHNTSVSQQRKIFVDINDKQKGVDMNYIIDIEGDTNPLSFMGKVSRLIKQINKTDKFTDAGLEYENILFSKIKIPSQGTSRRKYSMKGIYDAFARKKLVSPKLVTDNSQNPFFQNVDMNDRDGVDSGLTKLSRNVIKYLHVANKILGLDLKNMPNPPQYNLTYFLESGHMREGVVAVLIGFFERLTAAKIKKNSRTIIPNEEDFKKYLLPIAESLKNIVNYEDLIYLINTSGQGNRDQTIKRLCSVVKDAGYPEFDFDDLDDDLANIVDETKHIEKKLRETINQILSVGVGTDWCKGGKTDILPGKLENQLKENLHADIEINPQLVKQGRLYNGLTLGLSKDLILKHWDGFFANIFVVGGNKFTNKNQFDHALQHLGLYRNTDFHDMLSEEERQIIKRPDQKKLAQSYIKIFKTIFRDIEDSELVENSDDDENVEQSEASDQS